MLAKDLSTAARLEERVDRKTGISYRANLSYSVMQGDEQTALWVDTDEADRRQMILCATKFREQIVGEAFRLSNTVEHWNRTHPKEQPVQLELDLGPDVEWRRNSPGEDEKAV